jgi:hypothetical protein
MAFIYYHLHRVTVRARLPNISIQSNLNTISIVTLMCMYFYREIIITIHPKLSKLTKRKRKSNHISEPLFHIIYVQ